VAVAPSRHEREPDGAWLDADDVEWFAPDELRPWAYRRYGRVERPHLRLVGAPSEIELAPDGSGAVIIPFPAPVLPTRPGRPAYRQARRGWSTRRKRRFATRFVPTATVVMSTAVAIPWLLLRPGAGAQRPAALPQPEVPLAPPAPGPPAAGREQPGGGPEPAAATRAQASRSPTAVQAPPSVRAGSGGPSAAGAAKPARRRALHAARRFRWPAVRWHDTVAVGLPYSGGRLVNGVRLPQEGADWVTWDPALDRSPNREWRLFGTEELVRTLLTVIREYRDAHAEAPRVVIGDMSRKGGGPLDQHHSHQNGLDVDIYYPRLDHRPEEPTSIGQIDVRLAQDLVDRFVAAGAEFVFVGPSTPLIGPPSVVQKLANHDNHMHVRIRPA
jgi:hypothetical protein